MMYNDLMLFYSFYFFAILLLLTYGQQTIIYVKRGDTVELCDNRTTFIYAYEYRSFDGKKNLIIEPTRHERYSNPYGTSLLRINNVIENDSGQYKCPQDDIEWQKLQVYVPVQHVYLTNMHTSTHMHNNEFCGNENNNCLAMIEGEPLDIICAADGSPRPALDISLDKNGTIPTIMALANGIQPPPIVNDQFKSSVYEAYRIIGLIPSDNGRNITCQVDMKHIDKKLILSTTKQLYMEFRPSVAEKSKKIYCGINQTRTVNCTVIRANPIYIRYSINGVSSSIIHRTYGDQHDFYYTFDITPTSIEHFRPFNVTANNSIGFDTCTYELLHGDDTIAHLVANGNDKRLHQNGTVYDTPAQLINDKYSHPTSAYHQQKLQQYTDRDSSTSSVNSIPIRTRTVNNKFYDHPIIDNKYGPLSPTTMVVPTIKNDEEEGNESPVYSTTTDVLSESGSFLVPTSSSSKRYVPPPPKPRYSTLSSLRLPIENLDKSPLPLPKPRSRSNSRTRLNNPNSDNSSFLYEERPVSSTDSGMGQSDVVCLPNGDTIRSGLVKSRQNSLQKHYITPSSIQQQTRYQTLTSPIVHGTEC
ncbi:unnamed protein product [Rotaria sp. Silwood1]|nr:unnamed protein product [Rotaria sp. Silwood1]